MKIVIFGLTISSSWGNGHATIWRGLCKSLYKRGHTIIFFEKDVPYYAHHRDILNIPGVDLKLYSSWEDIHSTAETHLKDADLGMVTSFCPDGVKASELVLSSDCAIKSFYDLDTPITLRSLRLNSEISYLPGEGLGQFDVVLSYTGGRALQEVKKCLGARYVVPLYGCADPDVHKPATPSAGYICHLSYLGTYSEDRQNSLEKFFIDVSRRLPDKSFVVGGSLYPPVIQWNENILHLSHVPPGEHPSFYCSSEFTLNITRGGMAEMGYCPSGRLFEATACGVPVISDTWEGLDTFFHPGTEIITVASTEEVIEALNMLDSAKNKIALRGRERTLSEHTADHRAAEFENIFQDFLSEVK